MDTKKAVFIIPFGDVLISKKFRKHMKGFKKESTCLIAEKGRRISDLSLKLRKKMLYLIGYLHSSELTKKNWGFISLGWYKASLTDGEVDSYGTCCD
jgi:hypothetical protein